MIPGFVVIWAGQRVVYLTKHATWSPDASDAHVYATWAMAKVKARNFKGSDVVEAWL